MLHLRVKIHFKHWHSTSNPNDYIKNTMRSFISKTCALVSSFCKDVPVPVRIGDVQPAALARFSSWRKNRHFFQHGLVMSAPVIPHWLIEVSIAFLYRFFSPSNHFQVNDLSQFYTLDYYTIIICWVKRYWLRCHLQQLSFPQEAFHQTQRLALCHSPARWGCGKRDLSGGYRRQIWDITH